MSKTTSVTTTNNPAALPFDVSKLTPEQIASMVAQLSGAQLGAALTSGREKQKTVAAQNEKEIARLNREVAEMKAKLNELLAKHIAPVQTEISTRILRIRELGGSVQDGRGRKPAVKAA